MSRWLLIFFLSCACASNANATGALIEKIARSVCNLVSVTPPVFDAGVDQ